MTETEIREMCARYSDVLNSHQLDALNNLVNDEVVLNGHPVPRESVIAAVSHNIDAVPDMRGSSPPRVHPPERARPAAGSDPPRGSLVTEAGTLLR